MKKYKAVVLIQLIVIVWAVFTIIRLENERYALEIGMCPPMSTPKYLSNPNCLKTIQTRTSPLWHLAYALGVL